MHTTDHIPSERTGASPIDYLGVIDQVHFLAVVRMALRANGFDVPSTAMGQLAAEQDVLGKNFVENIFSRRLPKFAGNDALQWPRSVEAALWRRIPLAAALGWQQTRVLRSFGISRDEALAGDVLALGAIFNAGITVVDYIVDERPHGEHVFRVLQPELVSGIFDLSYDVQDALELAYRRLRDPHEQLLVALVGMFAAEGRRLFLARGNHKAWKALGVLILQLLDAERCTAQEIDNPEAGPDGGLLRAMEQKSVFPSLAMLHIAQLGAEGLPGERALSAATALGHVFWRIDDLVDLLVDCRHGVPSALVVRLAAWGTAQGRDAAADADLYDVVDQAACEIVRLLNFSAFGDMPLSVVEFARSYVGAWTNWQSDTPPPVRCGRLEDSILSFAGRALEALLAEQREDFRRAVHSLHFPRLNGQREVRPALLFIRSVALDAMLDARDAGFQISETILAGEALKVLQSKHRLVRGGWSYLPAVPELPPDADDTGQVIQVLWRIGGPALAAGCEEAVRISLDAMQPGGGVVTWTIDPRGHTQADEMVRAYLPVIGGWGVHPDVVANFAYGVALIDPVRFAAPLQKMASYLEQEQNDDGSWTSRWYDGPFYGTFRVAAVLRRVRPASFSMDRARTFILTRQHPDGSWGEPSNSSLSTAFALLALEELGLAGEPAFERGIEHLKSSQDRSGRWPSCRWIRFPTLDGEVAYGSETITTAFCLKALTGFQQCH